MAGLLFILPPHTTMMKKPIKLVRSTVINHDTANDNTRSDGDDNDDKENQPDNDQLDTISLKPQHKLLSIDIEPYLEEYLADNYFKIHQFKSFQKQGNKKRCCFVYYNAHTINTLFAIKGWVYSPFNNPKVCHRPHCKVIKDKSTKPIEPAKLVEFKKCESCQPPLIPLMKVQVMTLTSSD